MLFFCLNCCFVVPMIVIKYMPRDRLYCSNGAFMNSERQYLMLFCYRWRTEGIRGIKIKWSLLISNVVICSVKSFHS